MDIPSKQLQQIGFNHSADIGSIESLQKMYWKTIFFLVFNTIIKEVLRNENRDKIINIVDKIFNFNKQQKGKGF